MLVKDTAVGDWGNFNVVEGGLIYVHRAEKADEVVRLDFKTGATQLLASLPYHSLKGNRSLALGENGQLILTLLGKGQADIYALYPEHTH
ncbi:hypothetical protein PVT67_01060 [Gallaecimonas kandeliae]|uniref:hypothetical protein n=1 Tax=Gallaecimonas kandeliae TaxID=3029055 RepID=UPI00264A46D3|nr:hypothetical protein [Gallaecimonas kandeliae]WKE65878.1 hypothetical protein PVT67_01060 [Gallaecimonas kandeliae]